ncbi:phenoloxidase 1-like [Diabrotica undecimpunctata]|uniref:phenoloxidase 1-like n=1 Tax=Diabrotica undecimpunctata TaxID=50387 RepID=UPI003B63B26A
MGAKENLLLLFDRPREPIDLPKGPRGLKFEVPKEYLKDEYQNIEREPETSVRSIMMPPTPFFQIKKFPLPPLGEILDLGIDENFSLFIPRHKKLAARLTSIFMDTNDNNELLSVAVYARERVNPILFVYALSVAVLHRTDTNDLDLPSVMFSFPDRYVDSQVFSKVKEVAYYVPERQRIPIKIPMNHTASDMEDEQRLAYFREDIGVNLHHWHWHLVYPSEGSLKIVQKDRRGELFYYMHQQIIARYNFERLCNGMKRVKKFSSFNDPIPEGYYPKLDTSIAKRTYPARAPNMRWNNIQREPEELHIDIDEMNRWRDRIFDAIHSGFARDKNRQHVELTESEGIDILGNMIESSILSPDKDYYGDLHNMGHTLTSYVHDPDLRFLESFGVIGDTSTAMRDPFFYRWHAYMDDIFQNHKNRLPSYTVDQLNFADVTVEDVEVQTEDAPVNTFQTHWQQSVIDLSSGLDFVQKGAVPVEFTHLQHKPFIYIITVNNDTNGPTTGTCRIFMAPKCDERHSSWLFKHQKNMFIELDKFTVNLTPGTNIISRNSSESSVTIPFERTYRSLYDRRPTGGDALAKFNLCGCGWPENMLIPKGNDRFKAELFVMISDFAGDRIDQDIIGKPGDAGSYCGIKDKKYPDRRSMGYPFDRPPRKGVDTLKNFLTPNMKVTDVVIQFNNTVFSESDQ